MKTRLSLFVLLLASLGAAVVTYGQGEKKPRTDADYTVRSLRDLTTLQPDYIANNPDYKNDKNFRIVIHGELFPSRVKVVYEGKTRPLLENRKNVITQWAKRFAGAPEFYTSAYVTEMLFTEDAGSYWLAVRKELLPRFEQDLKKGEEVELFLIKLGNARIGDQLEPVLLVERFTTH